MRAAIVLAAGRSRRFGAANKLLTPYRGRPLIHHALAAACAAPVGHLLVVTGNDSRVDRCVRAYGEWRIEMVRAQRSRNRRDSLAAALRRLRPDVREVFVFLGDMPFVDRRLARRLVLLTEGEATRPVWSERPGHPVLLRDPARALARIEEGSAPFGAVDTILVTASRGSVMDIDRRGVLVTAGVAR